MKNWQAWVCVLAFVGLPAATQASDIRVRLDARDVERKRLHTALTLKVKPGPLTLVYAKWIPGEHAPTGPLDSMIGLTIRAGSEQLAWSRDPLDPYALRVVVPRGAEALDIAMESGLPADGAGFTAAPTSSAQLAILAWNEFLLFPKGIDADRVQVSASVLAPAGWRVVCALDSTPAADGTLQFEESSIARLIDSPVQMGRHAKLLNLQGSEPHAELHHSLSIMTDSAAALTGADELTASYGRLVAENGALFGSRMYRHYTWLLSLSDHVAHFGLEHHESSDNRLGLDTLGDSASRMDLAELLGHEYVHSWNGKYRRPLGLLSPDYQQPMDGSLLWIYEGMTQFWGEVLPTRAGLITPDYFREALSVWAGNFDVQPGSGWRPLADTAIDAQQLYSAPSAWRSSRRDTDFYEASVFLWLDVDAQMRSLTLGRVSLDDFVKRFYGGVSGAPQLKPYVEQDLYDTLAALAPGDWRTFVRRHLDRTGTAALLGGLEHSGWKLSYSKDTNAVIEAAQKRNKTTSRRWSIGLDLDEDGAISDVIDNRAAAHAGASPGMKLVAVNGQKYTAAVLDAAMTEAQAARQPIALLVESGDYFRTLPVEYYDGPRYPHLVQIDGHPDLLAALLQPRVK
jgi:predicted metalloprotease with PDZ domain